MFITFFKAFITLLSLGAVIWLAVYEANTGQSINTVAYYILAGVVFWVQSDQLIKFLDYLKK